MRRRGTPVGYHRGYEVREPIEVRVTPAGMTITSYPAPDVSVQVDALKTGRVVARRYRNRRIGESLKELFVSPKAVAQACRRSSARCAGTAHPNPCSRRMKAGRTSPPCSRSTPMRSILKQMRAPSLTGLVARRAREEVTKQVTKRLTK